MKAIVPIAVIVCLELVTELSGTRLAEKEGYYYEQRRRLGHFKELPFTDLYKSWAAVFKVPNFPDTPQDNYRFYSPAGDECMTFFREFRINDYTLGDIEELVVLDACLGYLYESEHKESDSEKSVDLQESLDGFIQDEKLRQLYDNTKIDEGTPESKECLGNLLLNSIQAKSQFSGVVCNDDWLELFNRFAECQRKDVPSEFRNDDSYGVILYELVKRRGKECFHNEIHSLNNAVRSKYIKNFFEMYENRVRSPFSSLRSQAKSRIWPKKITELLAAFQGTRKEINLTEINGIIRGIKEEHPNFKQRLLNNMARYADYVIAPKNKDKRNAGDPTGERRYKALIDRLCNFFRQADHSKYYDFATPFVRMVKMLEYPEIFEINEEYFTKKVLRHSYETAPLYLSVSSCNILTFTEAAFEKKPQNGPLNYKVAFKADTTGMVKWPDAGFY